MILKNLQEILFNKSNICQITKDLIENENFISCIKFKYTKHNYINDNKRTITMLKNEYVDNFIESIKYIIDGMNDRKDVEDA